MNNLSPAVSVVVSPEHPGILGSHARLLKIRELQTLSVLS